MSVKEIDQNAESSEKTHEWRICPKGYHYVRTHELHIPPCKDHPEGQVVIRHEHCAKNPSRKDLLSYDELKAISKKDFPGLKSSVKLGTLKKFRHSDKYDQEIIGWVHYWNDIFKLKDPLDPNLVKALIASESSFDEGSTNPTKSKKLGKAHGLMQLIDETIGVLADHKGELRDHLINLSQDEILDPSSNICAGVRWLFQKKITAAARLQHQVTWVDAVAEYKGILVNYTKHAPVAVSIMSRLLGYHKTLKGE